MSILYVNGKRMRRSILASLKWLVAKREVLNTLNVYPVPDGDTGTNMVLTLKSAVDSIENADGELSEVSARLSEGALMGARGNSGVILSQIIRGFSEGLAGRRRIDVRQLADSFSSAVERAYGAIANPVEGTILTVLRESSEAAAQVARTDPDIIHYLERLHDEAIRSLEQTPEKLPALKEAGVVDSGAMGFVCIVEGIMRLIRDEALDEGAAGELAAADRPVLAETYEGPRFCTEFIVRCGEDAQEKLREFLQGRGESLVFVTDTDLARVHIHSEEPAEILEFARSLGEVAREKVDDMRSQHQHIIAETAQTGEHADAALGLFCTAPGEGFARVFRSLGASQVVIAGDTNNPSVDDILRAAERVRAGQLVFLPNNKNIVLAAEQAAEASTRPMKVIPTRTVVQGLAASVVFDASGELDDIVEQMTDAMESVTSVAVTRSVRDATFGGVEIANGQYFALVDGTVASTGPDLDDTALEAVRSAGSDAEVVSMFYGQDIDEAAANALAGRIADALDDVEVEVHSGGQPHYPYIISIE